MMEAVTAMMERRSQTLPTVRALILVITRGASGAVIALTLGLAARAGEMDAARDVVSGDVSSLEVVEESGEAVLNQTHDATSAVSAVTSGRAGDDQILLLSTRGLGTRCDAAAMAAGLRCEQRDADGSWRRVAWNDVLRTCASDPLPTIIYVHGNRVASGEDKSHGLDFYRWLAARKTSDAPVRYVIWSWPSTQVPGRLKDYEVKAARTRPCGWQLAWAIDQWPTDAPLAVVGYSYGARVTTGALHVLGGGNLTGLKLDERAHPDRPPLTVALVAAALDAHWLRPEGYHGRAISQCESLVLVNNTLDPAMRFYPVSPVGRRSSALGYAGVPGRSSLGDLAGRIHAYDMTNSVGRHHALAAYLTSAGMLGRALEPVIELPPLVPEVNGVAPEGESALAGRAPDERQ
jgi:hypothetical protein